MPEYLGALLVLFLLSIIVNLILAAARSSGGPKLPGASA